MPDPNKFINPFHFVPPGQRVGDTSVEDTSQTLQAKPNSHEAQYVPRSPELLHDRYVAGTEPGAGAGSPQYFSGRILCKLTTKSPCVLGNQHESVPIPGAGEDATTRVENFSIGDRAAIAGTSLKGMLSTIAEMASGSAMRVLDNRVFSIRSTMSQSRSAIGMIVQREGKRKLLPLSLPTFKYYKKQNEFAPTDQSGNDVWIRLMSEFAGTPFGQGRMPVYLSGVQSNQYYPNRDVVALPAADVPVMEWDEECPSIERSPESIKKRNRSDQVILLRPAKGSPTVRKLAETNDPIPGIIRTLDAPRTDQGKTDRQLAHPDYSMFIPIAREWCGEDEILDTSRITDDRLIIDAEIACRDFDAIVGHPFSNAPHEPGRSATSLKEQHAFRIKKKQKEPKGKVLRDGDIVFFRLAPNGELESVSISGIWREGVRWIWDPATGDADLIDDNEQRPMNQHRERVTLAEKMFGWVDDVGEKKQESGDDRAVVCEYKGRIRISDAISTDSLEDVQLTNEKKHAQAPEELDAYFPLRILSSPKPPCPELYLTDLDNPNNEMIRVDFLDKAKSITIQGTKFYWAHSETIGNDRPDHWTTKMGTRDRKDDALKQRCFVRPIQCGVDFWFHIDFENLTETELQLLCYSLHPAPKFTHRCGFGKPLGLGAVQIEPQCLALLDRAARYGTDKNLLTKGKRFVVVDSTDLNNLQQATEELPEKRGYHMLCRSDPETVGDGKLTIDGLAEQFARTIPRQHKRILVSGTPLDAANKGAGIIYPRTGSQDGESESFRWFVNNRTNNGALRQSPLKPLPDAASRVEPLKIVWTIAIDHTLGRATIDRVEQEIRSLARTPDLILCPIRSKRSNRRKLPTDGSADLLIGFSDGPNPVRPRFSVGGQRGMQELREWLMREFGIPRP